MITGHQNDAWDPPFGWSHGVDLEIKGTQPTNYVHMHLALNPSTYKILESMGQKYDNGFGITTEVAKNVVLRALNHYYGHLKAEGHFDYNQGGI